MKIAFIGGSGPAYIFLFMESLVDAAVHIGLPRGMAQELVLETMLGSGHFAQRSGKPLAELRRMVPSPGGTTAVFLLKMPAASLGSITNRDSRWPAQPLV